MVFTADSRWQTNLIYAKHDPRGSGVHCGTEETCSCSRGIPQRELQEQLGLRRIAGLAPYCVYWNDRSEGVCLSPQHAEAVQKRVGASAAYKHFPDLYDSFLTNRLIICKSRSCLFVVYCNLFCIPALILLASVALPLTHSLVMLEKEPWTQTFSCGFCFAFVLHWVEIITRNIGQRNSRVWGCLVATW